MMKLIIYLGVGLFINSSCADVEMKKDNRLATIERSISAIAKYDTSQLYKLIDTSRCFNIYGKDGFLYKVSYAYDRLKVCGVDIDTSRIKIQREAGYRDKYTIPLCQSNDINNTKNDHFDLIFTFAEYKNDSIIDFMDIKVYRPIKSTIPVPNQ